MKSKFIKYLRSEGYVVTKLKNSEKFEILGEKFIDVISGYFVEDDLFVTCGAYTYCIHIGNDLILASEDKGIIGVFQRSYGKYACACDILLFLFGKGENYILEDVINLYIPKSWSKVDCRRSYTVLNDTEIDNVKEIIGYELNILKRTINGNFLVENYFIKKNLLEDKLQKHMDSDNPLYYPVNKDFTTYIKDSEVPKYFGTELNKDELTDIIKKCII